MSFDKATPSESEIRSALAKSLGRDEKLIVVKRLYTGYGVRKAKNVSYAYENEEVMKSIEPRPKEPKGSKGEAKEQKAEEKKQ